MCDKIKINEVVIVEGKYDINKLSQIIDAVIIKTDGFGIFSRPEKKALIRRLADERGIIVLTDSDGAGGLIRSHISSMVEKEKIKHLYIPQIAGKERRKAAPSKEGFLGVEGTDTELLRSLFKKLESKKGTFPRRYITKTDFYLDGLSGTDGCAEKRNLLARRAGLPEGMSTDALICALNLLFSYEEYKALQ